MRKEIIKGRNNELGTKHAIGKNQQAMTDQEKKERGHILPVSRIKKGISPQILQTL